MKRLIYHADKLILKGEEVNDVISIEICLGRNEEHDVTYSTKKGKERFSFYDLTCLKENDKMCRIVLGSEQDYILVVNDLGEWIDDNRSQ